MIYVNLLAALVSIEAIIYFAAFLYITETLPQNILA